MNTANVIDTSKNLANESLNDIRPKVVDVLLNAYKLSKEGDALIKRVAVTKAREQGKIAGREKGTHFETKKSKEMKKKIVEKSKHFGCPLNNNQLSKELGITINSLKKYIDELKNEEK